MQEADSWRFCVSEFHKYSMFQSSKYQFLFGFKFWLSHEEISAGKQMSVAPPSLNRGDRFCPTSCDRVAVGTATWVVIHEITISHFLNTRCGMMLWYIELKSVSCLREEKVFWRTGGETGKELSHSGEYTKNKLAHEACERWKEGNSQTSHGSKLGNTDVRLMRKHTFIEFGLASADVGI